MITIILISSTAIISGIGVIYVGRKAWYGFHHAVGIKPGKMTYTPTTEIPFKPELLQLNVTENQLVYVPKALKVQLQRIDDKAATYLKWKNELEKKHPGVLHTSEEQLVLSKLMGEHLPEIISTYHNINERKIQSDSQQSMNIKNDNQALSMLIELLANIESRLDKLLNDCEKRQIEDMKIMQRYLNARD